MKLMSLRWTRTSLALALMAVMTGGAVAVAAALHHSQSDQIIWTTDPPKQAKPLSLLQALAVARIFASNWQADAAVAALSSIDAPGESSLTSGSDGLRRSWTATFISSSGGNPTALHLTIQDGIVVSALQAPAVDIKPLSNTPSLDSPQAIINALAAARLDGAMDKTHGYQFSLVALPNGHPAIGVAGSIANNPASVVLDGATAAVLSVKVAEYGQNGGLLYSDDAGITWSATNLTGMILAVAADPSNQKVAYAAESTSSGIVINESDDSGKSWKPLATLPSEAGTWPFDLTATILPGHEGTVLLAGTRIGLWWSSVSGGKWVQALSIPPTPVTQVVAIDGTRVYAESVSGPLAGRLYSSSDLQNWTRVSDGAFRLSKLSDGSSLLAIDEAGGMGLFLTATSLTSTDLARNASSSRKILRAAGSLEDSNRAVVESPSDVRLSIDGGQTWRTVTEGKFSSLATSPGFDQTGVAIAGGFRTGIFRSGDAGETWQRVLQNPNLVVPGTGEIAEVTFLDALHVVAINLGERVPVEIK